MVEPLSLNFRLFTVKLVGVQKFRNFTVVLNFHDTQSVAVIILK